MPDRECGKFNCLMDIRNYDEVNAKLTDMLIEKQAIFSLDPNSKQMKSKQG